MSKLVRATDPTTGAEFTTSAAFAARKGLKTVDKPTHDRHGRILPDTPAVATTIDTSSSRKDLETAARAAGVADAVITAARTKAELVEAITTHQDAVTGSDDTEEA